MQNENDYHRAVELYEEASGSLDGARLADQLGQVIAILAAVIAEDPSADAYHLLGLSWYELPDGGPKELQLAEAAFRSALELNSGHQYANLYLGHVLFDTRRYEEASVRFWPGRPGILHRAQAAVESNQERRAHPVLLLVR